MGNYDKLTQNEINIICRGDKTAKELSDLLERAESTIYKCAIFHNIQLKPSESIHNRYYSDEETNIMNKFFVEKGAEFCKQLLSDRTIYSINNKANKLGLKRRKYSNDPNEKICCQCSLQLNLSYFYNSKNRPDGKHKVCKSCCKKNRNTDKAKKNKLIYDKKYSKQKRQTDINYKLRGLIRKRILNAIKHNTKSASSLELLGCSIEFVKRHLEKQFKKGMSWENHGVKGWHIDHIKPCAKFDLSKPEEQKICFHWSNLQPLWWHENLSKRDSY